MMWKIAAVAGLAGLALAEAGGCTYFYRRTMMRYNAKRERTMKMSGVNWKQYYEQIAPKREWMMQQPHEDVWIRSDDGLRLHATYFKGAEGKKVVICFHGYTSDGLSDYGSLSNYYLKRGFRMLLVDARAHGQSEGKYIGFGNKDRYDALGWILWMIQKVGEDAEIVLHGDSMGGVTVLMASGLDLPKEVKAIVSDCAFTSPKAVFTLVLHTMYHMPAFPMIPIADAVMDYILDLVMATHADNPYIREGASPRAAQALIRTARARAFMENRLNVSFEDVKCVALPVLRHRILLSFDAVSEGITEDAVIGQILTEKEQGLYA